MSRLRKEKEAWFLGKVEWYKPPPLVSPTSLTSASRPRNQPIDDEVPMEVASEEAHLQVQTESAGAALQLQTTSAGVLFSEKNAGFTFPVQDRSTQSPVQAESVRSALAKARERKGRNNKNINTANYFRQGQLVIPIKSKTLQNTTSNITHQSHNSQTNFLPSNKTPQSFPGGINNARKCDNRKRHSKNDNVVYTHSAKMKEFKAHYKSGDIEYNRRTDQRGHTSAMQIQSQLKADTRHSPRTNTRRYSSSLPIQSHLESANLYFGDMSRITRQQNYGYSCCNSSTCSDSGIATHVLLPSPYYVQSPGHGYRPPDYPDHSCNRGLLLSTTTTWLPCERSNQGYHHHSDAQHPSNAQHHSNVQHSPQFHGYRDNSNCGYSQHSGYYPPESLDYGLNTDYRPDTDYDSKMINYGKPSDNGYELHKQQYKMEYSTGNHVQEVDTEDLAGYLSNCLSRVQDGIQNMRLDTHQLPGNRYGYDSHGYNHLDHGDPWETSAEARAVHRVSEDGTLIKEERKHETPVVPPPTAISDLDYGLLNSGVAVWPGCLDKTGCALVVMLTKHPVWQDPCCTSTNLAKLLMYYYNIPRHETRIKGLTIVVDCRSCTLQNINTLLETLYTVHGNCTGSITMVHVLADKIGQTLLFKSPMFRSQVNLNLDLLMSINALYTFVSKCHLPPQLGGSSKHDHHRWVQFRMKLDPFLSRCREACEFLVSIMQDLTSMSGLPDTVPDTKHLISQHEQCVHKALDNPVLKELQTHGEEVVTGLSKFVHGYEHMHEDYSTSLQTAKVLLTQVNETVIQLVKLADSRLERLEKCLQCRQLQQDASQVLHWLCTEGEGIFHTFSQIADNLKGIRHQSTEFEKIYFAASTQLEKGSDILEEATLLTESSEVTDIPGVKDISKELKSTMTGFSSRLEDLREKIENASKCYHLLDKSYEWALDTMKYVASVKSDKDMSSSDLDRVIISLDIYIKDHPPITTETFESMLEMAASLENDKLLDQCKVAKSRCDDTQKLLTERLCKLKRARQHREIAERRTSGDFTTPSIGASSSQNSVVVVNNSQVHLRKLSTDRTNKALSDIYPTWGSNHTAEVCKISSPVGPSEYVLRRRSYAGKPSVPIYSPTAAAFKETLKDMDFFEYEEYLFSEGLITENMSDRIVTSIPKGLSNRTMQSSRESLQGSQENISSSSNLLANQKSPSSSTAKLCTSPAVPKMSSMPHSSSMPTDMSAQTVTLNKHNRPHRKMMRKANSMVLPEQREEVGRDRRNLKTLSMITGSTESLPSLPEEEGQDSVSNLDGRKQAWSPVPVNTHLMFQKFRNPALHQSVADLRSAEEEVKRRRLLDNIMREMVQTERDYVQSLQFIIDQYIPEMGREDLPQDLRGKRNVIFGNIERIYEFHSQYFLAELEHCEQNPFQISQIFLNHDENFYQYALYNKNKPKSDALMATNGSAFFRQKQIQLGDRMDLGSYLLKPVQRMGKYSLLLKQLIKECTQSEQELHDLKAAYDMIKFQLQHGNDLLAMDLLTGCDVNLQEQGMLLKQDTFLVTHGRKKTLRHVFLFEESVVFSKTKRSSRGKDVFVYKNSIKTAELGLTENVDNSCFKFELWFRKRKQGEQYIIQAPSAEVKADWVKQISRLLWQQAIRNREMRLSEMARMGVGTKPCLDLKQSKNNINDRFINISLSSRRPRTRNSIAVSGMDHLKNNKRPHSLISVSSTSSSSSNQSSSYGFGPLGVMVESPQEGLHMQKSSTLCSNESGIVADISNLSHNTSLNLEDACTQTTLRRNKKKGGDSKEDSTGATAEEGASLSLVNQEPQDPSQLLSTDV